MTNPIIPQKAKKLNNKTVPRPSMQTAGGYSSFWALQRALRLSLGTTLIPTWFVVHRLKWAFPLIFERLYTFFISAVCSLYQQKFRPYSHVLPPVRIHRPR